MTTHVDPITLELIKGMMRSARAEMEALIERTAMSPFIREKKDYFTAFFTRDGRMLFGTNLPLGGNLLDAILAQYPAETIRPGDLYWYNDCYGTCGGVSHSPDMVFVAPVFYDHQLVGFAETWGHLWDIGGMMPGSISPAATEVYHEGIIMPPIRIYREGVLNDEVFRIFARNSRFPDILKGDLRAILASCRLGKQRLEAIFARFGTDTTLAAFEQIIQQSTAAVRQAFETRVPDGSYSFRDYLDSDGITAQSYSVHLTLMKKNGTIGLDFSETDDQARGAVNFIMHDSVPKFMYGLYLTAGDPTILLNHGFARAIDEVKTRLGSLVNPIPPAPLGMRSNTMLRVNNCVFGTLALATDGQTNAASSVYVIYMLRSLNRQSGDYTLCIEGLGVGFGARPFADGPRKYCQKVLVLPQRQPALVAKQVRPLDTLQGASRCTSQARGDTMSTPSIVSHQYTPEDLLTMPDGHHFDLVDGHLVERHMGADRICSLRWCRPTIWPGKSKCR